MYITIDPYYTNQFYNQSKEALKNNNVQFRENIYIKPPYNWYFKLDQAPIMVNYDKLSEKDSRWIVSIVKPLTPSDEYKLLRRDNDIGPGALLKFIENEPMKQARESEFAVFFTVQNREELEKLSKEFPGKIWYFGKYYSNKFRVCLCTNKYIMNYLNINQILLEKTKEHADSGRFEADLNFKIFRGKDELVKYTETPYFQDGLYVRPKIVGDKTVQKNKFLI